VLLHREVVEEAQIFGQHADLALEFQGVAAHLQSADLGFAGSGFEQARKHLEGGGLARAIGSQKRADGPGGNFQREAIHGGEGAEAARELAAGNHDSIVP